MELSLDFGHNTRYSVQIEQRHYMLWFDLKSFRNCILAGERVRCRYGGWIAIELTLRARWIAGRLWISR